MAAAIAALRADGPVTIEGAEAVSKSYPAFFQDLQSLGVTVQLHDS
jgi:3-phosphoshikimate 1-carboxyvinyltransferase